MLSQKNSLFDAILKVGLAPSDFIYLDEEEHRDSGVLVRYKKEEYCYNVYRFSTDQLNEYRSQYIPGFDSYQSHYYSKGWHPILLNFLDWLNYLKRELSLSDKWEDIQKQLESGAQFKTGAGDEFKFSVKEYEDIQRRMAALKEGVKTIPLPAEQLKLIEAKLDHLTEVAKDMNKFDWKGLFVGSIAGIIIQLSMPASASGMLWELVKQAFSNMLTA